MRSFTCCGVSRTACAWLGGASKRIIVVAQAHKGPAQQDNEKPGTTETTKPAGLGQSFEVIVVRVVDNLSIIQGLVRRIDDLESAQSRARDGMIQEDMPGTPAHGGSLSSGHVERLKRRKALHDLTDTQPGNHQ